MDEVVLLDCQLGRAGRLALSKGEGKVRDDFVLVDALNGNPSPYPLPFTKGRGDRSPVDPKLTINEHYQWMKLM